MPNWSIEGCVTFRSVAPAPALSWGARFGSKSGGMDTAVDAKVEKDTAVAKCTGRCDSFFEMMMAGIGLPHDRLSTLWSLPEYHAEMTPDRAAIAFESRQTSYRLLRDDAEALAIFLMGKGRAAGDRIGYLGKNSIRYFALLFAVARMGGMHVPMGWRLASSELSFIVDLTLPHGRSVAMPVADHPA